jgi:uncharacterized protein
MSANAELEVPAPAASPHHRFRSSLGEHVLVVPFSRIYDVDEALGRRIDHGEHDALSLMTSLSTPAGVEVPLSQVPLPAPQSISLNVSSSCNLGCSYCYASRGGFAGRQSSVMSWEVARQAIEKLIAGSDARGPVTIGFLGGEPFVNRRLIHRAVHHAQGLGLARGRDVRFSVTTNGTLLRESDRRLLRHHAFAVTVSIDGGAAIQDARRPLANGARGSFELLRQGVSPLLENPGSCKIAARATVLPGETDLTEHFSDILALGFGEVGLSPLRRVRGADQFADEHWRGYLAGLIEISKREIARARDGGAIRLSNLAIALKQLHRGAASPFACGAGGGYFSVAADGKWYACHRAIGEEEYRLGDRGELDDRRREQFLLKRHVHAQTDCRQCWARYLCSGGCHQEAASRSPAGCDFIREWLDFCLSAYCELSSAHPAYFWRGQWPRHPS